MDHFLNPRNVGDVPEPEANGEAGEPNCGDAMRLSLRIKDGRILDARFRRLAAERRLPVPAWRPS